MRPYITKLSPRPGCPCCNTDHLHGYRGVKLTTTTRNLKRLGKKAMRAQLLRDLQGDVR